MQSLLLLAWLAGAPAPSQAPALIDVPFVAQSESLCGGAAMAMVMRYWGDRDAVAETFSPLIDASAHGIRTAALLQAVNARGWLATTITPAALAPSIARGQPVIALIESSPNRYHYVVVVGVTADKVVLHDPARAPYRVMKRLDFDEASRRAGQWMALVLPGDRKAAERQPPQAECDALVSAGIAAAGSGALEDAEGMLDAAMFRCPADPTPARERAGVAFAEKRYRDAARLAERALDLAPADDYTIQLLAASRYLDDDQEAALAAWRGLTLRRVDITGADRTPQSVILSRIAAHATGRVTADGLALARHRLDDIPSLEAGTVTVTPSADHRTGDMTVAVVEGDRVPSGLVPWGAIGARALFAREVPATFNSLLQAGDRLDMLWRFQPHREHLDGTLAVPAPRGLPGIVEVSALWERQSFGPDEHTIAVEERRRRGSIAFSDWVSGWLHWRAGAALDTFSGRRSAAISASADLRFAGDRVSIQAGQEAWFAAGRGGTDFLRRQAAAAFRTAISPSDRRVTAMATIVDVTRRAPMAIWPAADANFFREATLRAHALIDDGIVTGGVYGRRLGALTVAYEQPITRLPMAAIGAAVFVDAARAWQTVAGVPDRALVDLGGGIRVRTVSGTIRFDVAAGLVDHRLRATAGFVSPWPGRR